MSFAQTIIQGNIGKEIDLQYTPNGVAVAKFSVAVTKKFKDQEKTNWYPVKAFKGTAETIAKFFGKGDPILLVGEMSFYEYEKDGRKVYGYEFVASSFSFCGKTAGQGNQGQNYQQAPQQNNGFQPPQGGFQQPARPQQNRQQGQTQPDYNNSFNQPPDDSEIPF